MSVDYMNMHIIFNLQMIKNHCIFCKKQLSYYYIFKTLRFKSEQRTIIYTCIILVKFCLYISLFINVFQIHSIVMLLFGIIVITYVFYLFIWFISTHWQYRVRNVSTNYMYMKHFDWYNRSFQLKEPLQYSSFSTLHDQCIWLSQWWWETHLRRSTCHNWWATLSQ